MISLIMRKLEQRRGIGIFGAEMVQLLPFLSGVG